MGRSIKTLLVVLAAIMSFVFVQAVRADDPTDSGEIVEADRDHITVVILRDECPESVAGVIVEVDRYLKTIEIARYNGGSNVTIIGFPFKNLEAQLDEVLEPLDLNAEGITIKEGDCVTITYYKKQNGNKECMLDCVVNKWCSLTSYCEGDNGACTDNCTEEEDDMERKPQRRTWDEVPPGLDEMPPGLDKVPPGWDDELPPGELP
jgi:hypothetical protein